jgi:EmrB/QacA subfamily drug resistance transporter
MQSTGSEGVMEGRWRAFGVIAVAVFIAILDLFIVNIAFPDLQRQFVDADLSQLSWVLTGYAIVYAALLVPFGKLGDVYGRKRVFQAGLVGFVVGSALCAAAPSVWVLVAARVVQAAGAAALTPNSLGLLLPLFPARERAMAIGAWSGLGGVGAAAGPPLGGLLVEVSWRLIFLVNIPLGLLTVVLVQRRFAEIKEERATLPDGLGAAMLVGAVALLSLGLVQGPDWGWDTRVVASFAAAVLLGGAFVARSAIHRSPVLELSLLRVRAFALASAAALFFTAGFAALLLGGVLFLTQVWGYSVLKAGFAFAPGPAAAAVFAVVSGRLAGRIGPGTIGAAGGVVFALGSLWLWTRLGAEPQYLTGYLPGQIVGGAGVGLILPAFTAAAVATLPPERLATGIGAQTTFRQIGAALGVAAWVALVGTPSRPEAISAFGHGWLLMAACAAVGGAALLPLTRTASTPARAEVPAGAAPETAAAVAETVTSPGEGSRP